MSGEVRKSADLHGVSDGDLATLVRTRRLLIEAGQDTSAVDALLGIEIAQTKAEVQTVLEGGTPAAAQEPPKKNERRKKVKVEDAQRTGDEATGSPIVED
mgnify:CR=1 FL=1